ncbi:hypothetical protein AAG612_16220 [Citromicrobium bathyomarinum]|uniref:hypothetical protein n=1 Tax=Citromicrobium bathyomarinum TaxID=72174 RepID=UPI00315ACC59
MRLAFCAIAGASLALAACSQEEEQPDERGTVQADAGDGADTPEEADNGLSEWIVGTWSYDGTCASDFAVFYEADGTMHNDAESGTWDVSGKTLTETITEEFEMGEPGVTKIDPPRVRRIEVEMLDQTKGNLVFEGDTYPITRC